MTTSITNPEGVCNLALGRIKYPYRIGSIWEGSRASKACLDIYGQTRDDLLRTQDWPFARRDYPLTLIKQAPPGGYVPPVAWNPLVNPALPWVYEYAYPPDSLRIRSIRRSYVFLVNYDPREHRFTVTNDTRPGDFNIPNFDNEDFNTDYVPQKTILTNVGPIAIATYTGRITTPSSWDADFTEALCEALAERLAPMLTDMEAAKFAAARAANAVNEADLTQAG